MYSINVCDKILSPKILKDCVCCELCQPAPCMKAAEQRLDEFTFRATVFEEICVLEIACLGVCTSVLKSNLVLNDISMPKV